MVLCSSIHFIALQLRAHDLSGNSSPLRDGGPVWTASPTTVWTCPTSLSTRPRSPRRLCAPQTHALGSSLRVTKTGRAVLVGTLVLLYKNKGAVPSTGRPSSVERSLTEGTVPMTGTGHCPKERFSRQVSPTACYVLTSRSPSACRSPGYAGYVRLYFLVLDGFIDGYLARSLYFRMLCVTLGGFFGGVDVAYGRFVVVPAFTVYKAALSLKCVRVPGPGFKTSLGGYMSESGVRRAYYTFLLYSSTPISGMSSRPQPSTWPL